MSFTLAGVDVAGGIYVIDKAKLVEGRKLEQLFWDNGLRPTENGLNRILERFSNLVKDHLEIADVARVKGRLKAPKRSLEEKSTTCQRLLEAKEEEGGTTSAKTIYFDIRGADCGSNRVSYYATGESTQVISVLLNLLEQVKR